jgi:hypothetical protein
MPYTAADFKDKTTEILNIIAAEQAANRGSYSIQQFVDNAAVSELKGYINANPTDPRTFGYEMVGERLFIKPKNYIRVEVKPV